MESGALPHDATSGISGSTFMAVRAVSPEKYPVGLVQRLSREGDHFGEATSKS